MNLYHPCLINFKLIQVNWVIRDNICVASDFLSLQIRIYDKYYTQQNYFYIKICKIQIWLVFHTHPKHIWMPLQKHQIIKFRSVELPFVHSRVLVIYIKLLGPCSFQAMRLFLHISTTTTVSTTCFILNIILINSLLRTQLCTPRRCRNIIEEK